VRSEIEAELYLWNKNVDEMICLLQNIQASGVWSWQETARHEARLELLRAQLNANFRKLIALKKRVELLGLSEKNRGL